MASAPWRCSECGTINEPVANSCRTCGRWPSLFDLEASVVEGARVEQEAEPEVEVHQATTVVEPYDPRGEIPVEEVELELDEEIESDSARRRRRLTSVIVPLAFVVYLIVSIFLGDRGGG